MTIVAADCDRRTAAGVRADRVGAYVTLLAALCPVRKTEMVDGLVGLLIQLIHKISVRAARKVESEINAKFRRSQGRTASWSSWRRRH
jgi:hypothetical protein